jgi:cytochrome b6-f complex iron-sulfur subunit
MTKFSRRDFLNIATNTLLTLASLLGLGGLIRFLSYKFDETPPTEFDIGPASNYLFGSRTVLGNIPAVILHDEEGIRAISLICTHLGCTIEEDSQGFACPCHGSRFDKNGLNVKGPATQPLKKLRLEETNEGTLRVYTT